MSEHEPEAVSEEDAAAAFQAHHDSPDTPGTGKGEKLMNEPDEGEKPFPNEKVEDDG